MLHQYCSKRPQIKNQEEMVEPLEKGGRTPDHHGVAKEQLKIHTLTTQEKQQKQDREDDESLEANIDNIRRSGNLSPTQIERLKVKNKRGIRLNHSSQINTRSKKGSSFTSDQ
ncbi:hypothetical protein KY285_028647 [Solanum tuberosum]|nr:hypothetical protein KY289_028789 [Solanum tuberosum]KAH0663663.1 hypothetical protein KY284_028594 [Solanum tuberosum]KAH0667441.1 hypothetical protein KY285_028647 [Solanum tuberosum]